MFQPTLTSCEVAEIKVSLSVTCSITSEATTQSKDSGSSSASSSTVVHLYCTLLATSGSCDACLNAACILREEASTPTTSAPSLASGCEMQKSVKPYNYNCNTFGRHKVLVLDIHVGTNVPRIVNYP